MLNEIKWKDFFADCATYIMSEQKTFKINGDKKLVNIIASNISESRKLYNSLCSESTGIDDLKKIIVRKKKASKLFYESTGIKWPF